MAWIQNNGVRASNSVSSNTQDHLEEPFSALVDEKSPKFLLRREMEGEG